MKKIYISALVLFGASSVFAQVNTTNKVNSERVTGEVITQQNAPRPTDVVTGQTRATYLTEDFEGSFPPSGWTVTSGPTSTVTDPNQEWHKRDNGGFPQDVDPFQSTVPGGCAGILYINSVDQHDEWMHTPAIALPNNPCRVSFDFGSSVFWHAITLGGSNDNADIQVRVSTDGGATWDPQVLWQEDSLTLLDASYTNPWGEDGYNWQRAYVDLSAFQGQTVNVGFYYNGLDGAPFFLDNVSIEDTPANDIHVLRAWSGDVVQAYDHSMVPEAQVTTMRIGTVVRNLGGNAQTFDVTADVNDGSASVFNGTQNITSQPGQIDTLWWDTGYTPTAIGTYTVAFNVPADDETSNDMMSTTLETTEFIYAHDFTTTDLNGFDQDETVSIGNVFTMQADANLYGLDVKFETGTTADLFTAINVWQVGTNIQDLTLVDQLNYNVPASAIGSGVTTITFNAPIALTAGNAYVVEVQKVDQSTDRLYIGASSTGTDDNSTVCYGPFGTNQAVNWFTGWTFSPYVRMNFDFHLGIEEQNAIVGMSVFPNPTAEDANVSFELSNAANVNVTVTDLAGNVVYANDLGSVSAGSTDVAINTGNMANGVYMVNIDVDGAVSTEKLVVRK